MKRRKFFGLLGKATAVLTITPAIIASSFKSEEEVIEMVANQEREVLQTIFKPVLESQSNFYVSLYKSKPYKGEDNEADYKGYSRVAVPRNNKGWAINDNTVTNVNRISFPQCTGGECTIEWCAIKDKDGNNIYEMPITASLYVSSGIVPEFAPGTLDISED